MTRLALVGYGRIAPRHLEIFRALGCDIVAACNRSQEGRRRAQVEGGIPVVYSDIVEMLEREKPDGVVCCASFDQVYHAAEAILPRRIPTLLEKPPGTSLSELAELQALAARHATPVMVGMNRRHYSVVQRAVEDAGGLEAITSVFVDWSEDPSAFAGRGFSAEQVARMIFGNSLHGLDLLTCLAGPIPAPRIVTHDLGGRFRWVMALAGVSERGVLGTFQSSWDAPGPWRLTFCAAERRYTFAPLETCRVSERGVDGERVIEPDDDDRTFKPGFYRQGLLFLRTIQSGESPAMADLAAVRPAMVLAERLTTSLMREAAAAADQPHVRVP
jgi:predicted dehydrogenase